jgi:hypothetical protein
MATSPPRVGTAFLSALTKFQASISKDQVAEFRNTTYDQLCQEMMRLQHEQERLKTMMNMGRIESCLEAMHQFSKTVEIYLNVSDAVAFIWGPIKFLLLVKQLST